MEVNISAKMFFGARHGLQTLLQLIWFDDELQVYRILNEAQIQDAPKFKYRGLMLDTSRHFFSVESIQRTIHAMSLSKLNRFHWHITDSQSFPFRSKIFPQMAEYGAYSQVCSLFSGFNWDFYFNVIFVRRTKCTRQRI